MSELLDTIQERSDVGVMNLAEGVYGEANAAALSDEARDFLSNVLALRDGAVPQALEWLNSPVTALGGAIPADELRRGNTQKLNEFWATFEKVHGY